MKRYMKNIIKGSGVLACLLVCSLASYAYNVKFAFSLTSGWLSSWGYSDYAYKYSANESPVVTCTYTEGSSDYFTYTVRNSNNDDRVTPFSTSGTFDTRAFSDNQTAQNYKYKLGVQRGTGAWNTSARCDGLWNVDSY